MKRNEFMQIEAEEPKYKEDDDYPTYPEPDPETSGEADIYIGAVNSFDIQPDSYPYESVEGPRPAPAEVTWSPPTSYVSDIPTRTINENDAEYVERCIRYIIDRGNIRDTHVRRVLYQTMSSLTDIPSAPPPFAPPPF